MMETVKDTQHGQSAETQQAAISAWVSSGFIDECIATLVAFEQRGVEHLPNSSSRVVYNALGPLGRCTLCKAPGCEAKIRGVASALAFAQDNSLDYFAGIGYTTGASATSLICTIWGREEDSEFTFTQAHVDSL